MKKLKLNSMFILCAIAASHVSATSSVSAKDLNLSGAGSLSSVIEDKVSRNSDFKFNKSKYDAVKSQVSNKNKNKNKNSRDMYLISDSHVNRIVTPFSNPSLKIDAIGDVQYKTSGGVIYLSTPSSMKGKIIAGFVTEKGDESNAIRFMLRPEAMPPQEVSLMMVDDGFSAYSVNKLAKTFEASHPRTETIMNVLSSLVVGDLPMGYTLSPPVSNYFPDCSQSGLISNFYEGQLAQGGDYVVAIGTLKNSSDKAIDFRESSCYSKGLVAVTTYPKSTLEAGDSTELFVMMYRNQNKKQEAKARRSLLTESFGG